MAKYSYERGKATFVNPYNFVRMDKTKRYKTSDSDKEDEKKLSGVLHCSFETKTPLAIPDVEKVSKSENGHASYPFYEINGVLAVPGSSIRGMLRSMYETLTDSCFVTLTDNESITARTAAKSPFKPGILIKEENSWGLYRAKRYNLYTGKNSEFIVKMDENGRYIEYKKEQYRTGEPVDINVHKEECEVKGRKIKKSLVDSVSKTDKRKYFLYVGEEIKNKKYESVFEIQDKIELPAETINGLLNGLINSIKVYQNKSINKKLKQGTHTGYRNFEHAKENGAVCVWYKEVDGRYYLSMAAIGRKSYNRTVNDMIGEHRKPCTSRSDMCPACKLFGMAKGDGYGSRIRITDAIVDGEPSSLGMKCLKELGSPRTGYYPFYTNNGKEYDQQGVNIAGRKYYWHIPQASKDASIYTSLEETERNSTMELLDVGVKFSFDVYYDNVSKEQLEEIKWILTLPDDSGNMMHKLGHGKPLGLGSVKITISADERREFDGKEYKIKEETVGDFSMPSRFLVDAWKQLAIITNFEAMADKKVCYPYVEMAESVKKDVQEQQDKGFELKPNVMAGHQWFNEFKKVENNVLPDITHVNSEDKNLNEVKLIIVEKRNDFIEKRKKGKIKFYKKEQQYGFIISESGEEIYYRGNDVEDNAKSIIGSGVKVTFCEKEEKGKKSAKKIRLENL